MEKMKHSPSPSQQKILMLVSLLNFSSPFTPNVPKIAAGLLVTLWIPGSTTKCQSSVNASISWKTTSSSTRGCLLFPTELVLHMQLLHWGVPAALQSLKPGEKPALCCSAVQLQQPCHGWIVSGAAYSHESLPICCLLHRVPTTLPPAPSHNSFICSTAHFQLILGHMRALLFSTSDTIPDSH